MDRRAFLALTGLTAAGATASTLIGPTAAAVDDGKQPGLVWLPTKLSPALTVPLNTKDPASIRGFPTMLPAGALLGENAIDAWYLWLWTHDTPFVHLYTAPSPTGPFTARGQSAPPAGMPEGYQTGHFSSGDVVWDPTGRRFICSPHSAATAQLAGNSTIAQDSFLTTSTDGVHWTWLDGDNRPRLTCGPPGSIDSVHTGYGRLLRDLDGHITTHQDRYWWLYRAQRRDAGAPTYTYTPYLASAASLADDFTTKRKAYNSNGLNLGLFDVGSFIRAGGAHHVFQTQSVLPGNDLPIPSLPYYNRTSPNNLDFLPVSVPVPLVVPGPGAVLQSGTNVIRDPATRAVYLVTCAAGLHRQGFATEIWVFRLLL